MDTAKSDSRIIADDLVRFGRRTLPVAAVYSRICQHAGKLIWAHGSGRMERMGKAARLIAALKENLQVIDALCHYASHPLTDPDVIVAHAVNVTLYSLKLAAILGSSKEEMIRMGVAALLHDIGLCEIPSEIVFKRKQMTSAEFASFKKHPRLGYEQLKAESGDIPLAPELALQHHERIDGSGYPERRKRLSELTELFSAVDFFEAVTHHRPQRGAVTPHEGMRMLKDRKNGPFSRNVVKTLLNAFSLYPVFSIVRLSSGEVGQVIRANENWPLQPVVRVLFDSMGNQITGKKEIDLFMDNRFITKDISDRVFLDNYFKLQ